MEVRLVVPELLGYLRTQARQSKEVSEIFFVNGPTNVHTITRKLSSSYNIIIDKLQTSWSHINVVASVFL